MITTITKSEHAFVLEADRTEPEERQTVFYIIPKTVRGATETAAAYAGVQIEKKRSGKKEIDIKAMQRADDQEWIKAIKKIENFGVTLNCPGADENSSGYDHFLAKSESDPSNYVVDKETGVITVVSSSDPTDLKYFMWGMSPADQEEIMSAYFSYSELKAGLKNV